MRRIAALALLSFAALVPAASADAAQTLTFKGIERKGVVEFRAGKLKNKKVRKLSARVNGRQVKLSAAHKRHVTKKGVLRIRPRKTFRMARRPLAKRPAPKLTATLDGTAKSAPAPAQPELVAVVDAPTTGSAPAQPTGSRTPDCPATEGPFGPGRWPSHCWRPYNDQSPFNRGIGESPRVHPSSDAYVQRLTAVRPQTMPVGNADTEDDWNHPTYWNAPGDPVYTIHCAESWGKCAIEGMRVPIPEQARPAGGGDGHMTVVDQATGWEYDFWQVRSKPSGGGTVTISWGGRTRIDGDGLNSGATAPNFGNLAGIIRAQELAAGRIDHALFMTYPCDAGGQVYPAAKGGSKCSSSNMAGAFPMGTRFQLAMSDAEIDRLAVPAWKKTILRAMAKYGMYFGDTGGGSWALQFESGSTYTSFGMADPLVGTAKDFGIAPWQGTYGFELASGVDWRSRLRALDPCTAQGTC